MPTGSASSGQPAGTLLVAPADSPGVARALRALHCQIQSSCGDVAVVAPPPHAHPQDICAQLRARAGGELRFAEPELQLCETPTQTGTLAGNLYGNSPQGLDAAALVRAGPPTQPLRDFVVAVCDDGVWPHHPALQGQIEGGYDYVLDTEALSGQPARNDQHGTTCAGIIAGSSADFQGIAPGCRIAPYRIGLTVAGNFSNPTRSRTLALTMSLERAWQSGARVASLSLGGQLPSSAVAEMIQKVTRSGPHGASTPGMVVVVAAGNRKGPPMEPACYPEVIPAAGAVPENGTWRLARTPQFHSAHCPSFPVMAPAWNLRAPTLPAFSKSLYTKYAAFTSIACPIFAGAVVRLLAKAPKADTAAVRGALLAGARDVGDPFHMKFLDVAAAESYL